MFGTGVGVTDHQISRISPDGGQPGAASGQQQQQEPPPHVAPGKAPGGGSASWARQAVLLPEKL